MVCWGRSANTGEQNLGGPARTISQIIARLIKWLCAPWLDNTNRKTNSGWGSHTNFAFGAHRVAASVWPLLFAGWALVLAVVYRSDPTASVRIGIRSANDRF
jgi:hypothetical protein